jgi:hypothetical protein
MKRHKLTKRQIQEWQNGCDEVGVDYFFLDYASFANIKDTGFQLRLSEWRQARSELLNYLGLEVD